MEKSFDSERNQLQCEEQPFLVSEEGEKEAKPGFWSRLPAHPQAFSITACLAHFVLILCYTSASIALVLSFRSSVPSRYNALRDLDTQYKYYKYGMMRDSPYIGPPGDDVDEAWHALFGNMSLRVSAEELARHSQTSVSLPDGGYLAWLGVYHNLHCVKVLRQVNYREYYHPNLTKQGVRDLQIHADHCIDQLRNALMCHGDTESLTTFIWSDQWSKPLLSPRKPQHRCLNWDAMVESLWWRIVSREELHRMSNPILSK